MPYAILRIQKLKQSNLGGSGSHVSRSRITPNADQSKRDHNQTIIHNNDADLPLPKIVQSKIDSTPLLRKIRTDAIYAFEILLTASPDFYRPDNPADYGAYDPVRVNNWLEANINWLKAEYGDKVVRAELHLDEATPHIHAYVVPIDDRGQLNYKKILGGSKQQLIDLQNSYAKAMLPLGLARGKSGSLAEHTNVKKYYTAVNEFCDGGGAIVVASLQAENARLEQRLLDITDERDRLREKIKSLPVDITGITPVINKTKTSSTNSNRPPNRSPISDGDPRNHIGSFLTTTPRNESTNTPPVIVTSVLTVTPPEIERSARVTEIAVEEVPKISSRPPAKSRDRGGR